MSTAAASYASEALVGPPSQLVSVHEFIHACSRSTGYDRATSTSDHPEERAIAEECSVADLQASLNETLSNPFKYAFLVRNHENIIDQIRSASKPHSSQTSKPVRSRKRKRTERSTTGEDDRLHPDVLQLQNGLESIALSCWSYPTDAALFTRPQKNSDLNTLTKPKRSRSSEQQQQQNEQHNASSSPPPITAKDEAILIISIYNRLSWGNHLSRSSQHAVLASQTIGDLYDVIPCPSNEIPHELRTEEGDGDIVGYNSDELPPHRGAVVCIEGVAFGDGQVEDDYSVKLVQQMELLPEKKRKCITKGACMHDQRFVDLTIRVNEPYWLLHQGTCEHFLIIDTIRMLHPNDPKEGYPLTLHIAPPIIDLCMACSRVPAALSIVDDIRLGQSPFKICQPCWDLFGEPNDNTHTRVLVVPLPKYEHGW
ncbi:hypothetical protein ACEPAF_7672 [Sanghuangporus sanghuang]